MSAATQSKAGTVLLVGCGQMGSAMLRGWLSTGAAERFVVVEPAGLPSALAGNSQIAAHAAPQQVTEEVRPDAVVFAVKPQVMDEVLPPYRRWVGPATLFLSIAAGKTIGGIARHL